MEIKQPTNDELMEMLGQEAYAAWMETAARVDALYDVDRLWNKGFGAWKIEYKYRRGGKTLCAFYAKEGVANLLIVLGGLEREKVDAILGELSTETAKLYTETQNYHDGKWLWLPLDAGTKWEDVEKMLRVKRKPTRK